MSRQSLCRSTRQWEKFIADLQRQYDRGQQRPASLITRELAFAIVEAALNGTAVCSVTQFVAAPDQALRSVPEKPGRRPPARGARCRQRGASDQAGAGCAGCQHRAAVARAAARPHRLAIKLDSPGTVLFVQERLGRGADSFPCLKFRTMCRGRRAADGPVWAADNDPRITRAGLVLAQEPDGRAAATDQCPARRDVAGRNPSDPSLFRRTAGRDHSRSTICAFSRSRASPAGLRSNTNTRHHSPSRSRSSTSIIITFETARLVLDLYIMFLTVAVVVRMKGNEACRGRSHAEDPWSDKVVLITGVAGTVGRRDPAPARGQQAAGDRRDR